MWGDSTPGQKARQALIEPQSPSPQSRRRSLLFICKSHQITFRPLHSPPERLQNPPPSGQPTRKYFSQRRTRAPSPQTTAVVCLMQASNCYVCGHPKNPAVARNSTRLPREEERKWHERRRRDLSRVRRSKRQTRRSSLPAEESSRRHEKWKPQLPAQDQAMWLP